MEAVEVGGGGLDAFRGVLAGPYIPLAGGLGIDPGASELASRLLLLSISFPHFFSSMPIRSTASGSAGYHFQMAFRLRA